MLHRIEMEFWEKFVIHRFVVEPSKLIKFVISDDWSCFTGHQHLSSLVITYCVCIRAQRAVRVQILESIVTESRIKITKFVLKKKNLLLILIKNKFFFI